MYFYLSISYYVTDAEWKKKSNIGEVKFVKEFPSVAIDDDDEDTFQREEDVLLRRVSNFESRLKITRDLEMVLTFCR